MASSTANDERKENRHVENIPVPDPSLLTTAAIYREIATLREIIETRLDGMDRAFDITETRALRQPSNIDTAIAGLKNVIDEKFAAVETRFMERDARVAQTSEDGKTAIKAALDAAKEAVGKTEVTVTKQIDQIYAQMHANTERDADKFDDLKTRIGLNETRIQAAESIKLGASEIKGESKDNHLLIIGGVGAVIAAMSLGVAIMVAVVAWNHTTPAVAPAPQSIQVVPAK